MSRYPFRFLLVSALTVGAVVSCRAADPPTKTAPYTWKSVAINGGGFISGIVTHPREKGLIYARTDVGGAYRWDAGANRWESISDGVSADDWTLTGIESLAVDPTDPNRVYLAAGTYTNDWSGNGAVLRSQDRGRTWQRADLPFKLGGNEDGRSNGERLAVDPDHPETLFMGTRMAGLWKSADRGATWKRVESFPAVATANSTRSGEGQWSRLVGIVFVQFMPGVGGKSAIYAGVATPETSLFRSTDGGATWQPVAGQPTGLRPNHATLAADGSLYLSYGNQVGPNGVTDGAVWKLDTKSGAWADVTPLKPSESDRFGYGGVSVDARQPGTLVACTIDRWAKKDEVFRSTDGGETWKPMLRLGSAEGERAVFDASSAPYAGLQYRNPHWLGDVEIDPNDSDHILFVTGYGVWATRDATAADKGGIPKWSFDNAGIEECVADDVASPATGEAHALSAVWDIDGFRHVDLDASPKAGTFTPNHGHNTALDVAGAADVIVRVYGGATGGAYSLDNGATWTEFAGKPAESRGGGAIAVSAEGKTFVVSPDGVNAPARSVDKGATWQACTGLPGRLRVVADRVDTARFYAFDNASGTVYASTDGGVSFHAAASGLPKGDGYLRTVPGMAGNLWLAASDGLYRSADGGATFVKLPDVTQGRRIGFGKAAPGKTHPAAYLIGRVSGVYGIFRSDDTGATWVRINDDQHQCGSLNAITGDPRVYGRVYIASANRGILYADPK